MSEVNEVNELRMSPWLLQGTGYEARQTSKEQTKMPRFMLEGPQPCTITMHELRTQHVFIG